MKATLKNEICDDIMLEVLSRLEVKTLCKFRCVSKHWCNLISNPHFINIHHNRSQKHPKLLFLRHSSDYAFKNKKHPIQLSSIGLEDVGDENKSVNEFTIFVDDYVKILPCKGDVICLAAYNQFYVCNPSTQEFVSLPAGSPPRPYYESSSGFGYLPCMNEYILVHLFNRGSESSDDFGCEIFTLSCGGASTTSGSDSWRVVEEKCPHSVHGFGVMTNKTFYWIINYEIAGAYDEFLLSFDTETEKFGTVPPPRGCSEIDTDCMYMVEFRGCLCMVDNYARPSAIELWLLKPQDDNKNLQVWVKEYIIYVPVLNCEMDEHEIFPLHYQDGEILICKERKSLYYYNMEKKSIRKVENLKLSSGICLRLYTDSFFSLGSR